MAKKAHIRGGKTGAGADVFARKLASILPVNGPERTKLAQLLRLRENVPDAVDLLVQGRPTQRAMVFLSGWGIRSRTLDDGRRQIINFVLPGDFAGLSAAFLGYPDHSVTTVGSATIAPFTLAQITAHFADLPHVLAAMCCMVAQEEAVIAEHLVDIGQREGYERVSHLLLEILVRLEAVGLAEGNAFSFPVTQDILSQALGMSPTHINRTLKKLRANNIVEFKRGRILVRDRAALIATANFEPAYLHLTSTPWWIARKMRA